MIPAPHARRHTLSLWDDSAQALPFLVLLITLFLGMSGLCLDLGHAYVCQSELQASTDAAALAGGAALADTGATAASVTAAAKSYSSASTGANATTALPSVTFSATLKCLTTLANQSIYCGTSATNNNAIQVTQTATITTWFIQVLNVFNSKPMTSLKLTATSTAAMKGAGSQYNVAILVDTTGSMGSSDSDASCKSTRIKCALSGIQTLLSGLTPCTVSGGKSCTGFDNVSLFTFPNVTANTAQNDYKCNGKNPTIVSYATPVPGATWSAPNGNNATYQVTGFLDDYSSTNSAGGALNTSSDLTIASGGKSGCQGMQTPGGDGTYYAGAIYAALSALNAEQVLNPGSKNALIILSDGDASSDRITATSPYKSLTLTGVYPSLIDQCHQAITAAQSASSTTTVYTVAYGAGSSGCATDIPSISPCTAMEDMATAPQDFYSDATASQNKGQCTSSSNPNLTLNQIFTAVKSSLQSARLIPNNTT